MKKEIFTELLESLQQGGKIVRGKTKPNRVFQLDDPDVPEIRKHIGPSQEQFTRLLGASVATFNT